MRSIKTAKVFFNPKGITIQSKNPNLVRKATDALGVKADLMLAGSEMRYSEIFGFPSLIEDVFRARQWVVWNKC